MTIPTNALIGLVLLGLIVLSLLPLFSDTYSHRSNVNFWVWAEREVIELQRGEK